MNASLTLRRERWALAHPLVTADTCADSVEFVVVEINDGHFVGRAESAGVYYHGETGRTIAKEIETLRPTVEAGLDRNELQRLAQPGGARNAIDCALWELEARRSGRTVAELVGIPPSELVTMTTLSLAPPAQMADQASGLRDFSVLKLKVGKARPLCQVRAVRMARPDARLIVDANASWTPDYLYSIADELSALGVALIEQPCPPSEDGRLDRDRLPLPLCADESCHTRADLPRLARGYRCLCLKLDKTGGLTEALALAREGRLRGFDLMIGNMLGTSLAMAPVSVLGPWCRYVDIDGPLLLREDRRPGMRIDGERISPLVPEIWG